MGNGMRRALIATVLGVILYGGLNYYLDFLYKNNNLLAVTGVSILNNNIDTGIILADLILIIPLFLAAISGPLVGLLTIIAGLYFGSLFAGYDAGTSYYGASWTWFVGRMLIGLIAGLAVLLTQGRYNTVRAIVITVTFSAVEIVIGTAFTSYVDVLVSGIKANGPSSTFTMLALPCVIDLIVLPILLVAYTTIVKARGRGGSHERA